MNPYLTFFIGGFIGGIVLRLLFPSLTGGEPFVFGIFLIFLGLIIFLIGHMRNVAVVSALMVGAVFIGSCGLGVMRVDLKLLYAGDPLLDSVVEENITIRGVVDDEADIRERHTKLTVRVEEIFHDGVWREVSTKILVTTEHFPEYIYGDRIVWRGVLEHPENFTPDEDEDGRPFDYVSYLAKSGIYYQMFYPEGALLERGQGNIIREKLFALKALFISNTARVIPEPASSLLGGVVVGAKQSLGEELLDDFRRTGVIHIVVLSGYNITIVAEAIGRLASYAPRMIGFGASSLAIVAFALMTGAGATIVRASIMALLVMYARLSGRVHAITSILFLAGFLMLAHNPLILLYDPSFQLSFLATIGLIYFAPRIEEAFSFLGNRFGLRSIIGATLSTQIFVLPLLLYMMGEISLVALPVNLLILLFVPATMLLGFLTALFGLLGALFSLPFAYLTYFLLTYELAVVDFFARFPFASVSVPYFPLWLTFFFYGVYVWFIWKQKGVYFKEVSRER